MNANKKAPQPVDRDASVTKVDHLPDRTSALIIINIINNTSETGMLLLFHRWLEPGPGSKFHFSHQTK